jgi:formamidopyrimidine-DNA glycosylase
MPEIPEIASRAAEMNQELVGKTIKAVEVLQPRCLNIPPGEFEKSVTNSLIESVIHHGKWIKIKTSTGWILINLGMGGEILLTTSESMPEKYRIVFHFEDNTCLAINFWWFGYVHFCAPDEIAAHAMLSRLGPNILDLAEADFYSLIKPQRSRVKAFLFDQSKVAGIGNAYIHDILFLARIHPNTQIPKLTDAKIHDLYQAIQDGLRPSLSKGGAFYEKNIFGQPGGFKMEDIIIGYRDNNPCPACGTPILKIKTGGTSSFICPKCQPEM